MKRIIEKLKNLDDIFVQKIVISIFLLQILFELDGNIYEILNQIGLPRPSTVFHLIIIPLLIVFIFIRNEKKKKSVIILFSSYLLVLLVYFVLHCINASSVRDELYLTGNFIYSHFQEFVYVYTLVIPYFIVYLFYRAKLSEKIVLSAIFYGSFIISILIILGDLFLFGESTYNAFGTKATFFSWFTGIYDDIHPRDLASKFFFPEGNTLGIYQFILLPLLYYIFSLTKKWKDKLLVGLAIIMQSLAMVILATRVATYGTIIMPIACLILWLLFVFIKQIKFDFSYFILCICMSAVMVMILPYTPAYVNQQLDSENNFFVKENKLLSIAQEEGYHENYSKYDPALIYKFYVYGIEGKLMSATPEEYYLYYYDYRHDPGFWWNVLTEVPFEQRVNGRQIQTLFNDYKWNETNQYTKLMGMGYSTFMNGSFLLERDFVQQLYTLGYFGDVFTLGPWIGLALVGIYGILRSFKKNFTFKNMSFAMAFCAGIGASYMSGHTLDQYLTTILLALIVAFLLNSIFNEDNEVEKE